MGTFSRFRHVVSANVNALLERAEDPEKMLKALVREMEDALGEAREAAAGISAERKQLERRIEQLDEETAEWQVRAEKALDKGHEDLARQALARKMTLTEEQQSCRESLQQAQSSVGQIEADIQRLEERLKQAKAKQKEQLQKQPVRQIPVTYRSPAERRLANVMTRFNELETRMEQMESRVESYDLGRTPSVPFTEEVNEQVEEELAALKARVGGASKAPAKPAPEDNAKSQS